MEDRTTIQVSGGLRKKLRVLAAKRDISYQKLLSDMISVFEELEKDKTVISIPKKLSETVKEKIKQTDFRSVSEYLTFIMRLILYENAETSKQDIKNILKNQETDL
jgi:vacuolar-type H+-ATPase subunit E/Vma4